MNGLKNTKILGLYDHPITFLCIPYYTIRKDKKECKKHGFIFGKILYHIKQSNDLMFGFEIIILTQ